MKNIKRNSLHLKDFTVLLEYAGTAQRYDKLNASTETFKEAYTVLRNLCTITDVTVKHRLLL